jgi:hypothetical protein
MAVGDTFEDYAFDYYKYGTGGESFDDPALALFEDTGSNGASVKIESNSWFTETVEWRFNSGSLGSFMDLNPTLAYLEFQIEWSVQSEDPGTYAVSLSSFLSLSGVPYPNQTQINGNTATNSDSYVRKTAIIRVFGNNIPFWKDLKETNFGIATKFNISSAGPAVRVYIYEIKIKAVSGTNGSYVVVYDQKSINIFTPRNN